MHLFAIHVYTCTVSGNGLLQINFLSTVHSMAVYVYCVYQYTGDAGPQDVLCEGARHLPSLAERSRGTAAEDAHQGERLLEITGDY